MEVRIRMRKVGKITSKRYHYKIVAISRTKSRDGRFLDDLGFYDPAANPAIFKINQEKLDSWLKKGAQVSLTIKNLLKSNTKMNQVAS